MVKMECKLCHKEVGEKRFKPHLKKYHIDFFENENAIIVFTIKNRLCLTDSDIENIKNDYKTESIKSITEKYKLPYRSTEELLRASGIKIKSISDSLLLKSVREKVDNTNILKYGFKNVSQNGEIKNKKKETFLEHYGVDNIFKTEKFKKELNEMMLYRYGQLRIGNPEKTSENWYNRTQEERDEIIQKTINTKLQFTDEKKLEIIEKYKQTISEWSEEKRDEIYKKVSDYQKNKWNLLSKEEKNLLMKRLHNGNKSKLEERVQQILNEWSISYIRQFSFNKLYLYDFFFVKSNIILEVNGDFWHGNPMFYDKNDIVKLPGNKITLAKDIWKKDLKKRKSAEKKGYKIVHIWEYEIKKLNDEELEFLMHKRI